MANRYSTIDELNEVAALIQDVLVTIKGALQAQQEEIKLIAKELEDLREDVYKINGGEE